MTPSYLVLKASSFKTFATIARSPYMEFLLPLLLTSLGISPLHAATTCAYVLYSLRILYMSASSLPFLPISPFVSLLDCSLSFLH
jgi:hypothetical protein